MPSFAAKVGVDLHGSVPQQLAAVQTPLVAQHRSAAFTGQAAPFTALPQEALVTHAPLLVSQIVLGLVQSPSLLQPAH